MSKQNKYNPRYTEGFKKMVFDFWKNSNVSIHEAAGIFKLSSATVHKYIKMFNHGNTIKKT